MDYSSSLVKTTKRDKIEKHWGSKVKEGEMNFQIVQDIDVQRLEWKLILDNFPEEVPARVIQCYLMKYLIEPEVIYIRLLNYVRQESTQFGPLRSF